MAQASTCEVYCQGPDCDRVVQLGGTYCEGHRKQVQRGQPLRPIERNVGPFDRMFDVFWEVADAEEDDEYEAGRVRFMRCVERLMLAGGWKPPRQTRPNRPQRRQLRLPFDC